MKIDNVSNAELGERFREILQEYRQCVAIEAENRRYKTPTDAELSLDRRDVIEIAERFTRQFGLDAAA